MNKWWRFLPVLLAGISVLLSVSSCSPARRIIRQPVREEGPDFVFSLLKRNEIAYKTLSMKFSAKVIIDKKASDISGQVRIQRDSVIWASLTPVLGIEAARILITLDSVLFINRMNNTYLRSDFSFINNNLNSGFDFDLLQALLVGNDLRYYENDQFRLNIDGQRYKLHTIGRRKLKKYVRNATENLKVLIQNIWIDPETGKIEEIHTKELDRENKKLEIRYSDFVTISNQRFPTHQEVKISAEKEISISLDFSKIKLDENLSYPFSIPAKFTNLNEQ